MKLNLLFASLLLTLNLLAQDYLPVQMGQTSYYQTSFFSNGYNFNDCYTQDCVIGLEIDSMVQTVDSIQAFYFTKMLRTANDGFCEDDSWLGERVRVLDNGDHLYENENDEQILIKPYAGSGETWTMFELTDSTFFEASLIERVEFEILGQMDSVVTIEIIAKDAQGMIVEHELNNQQIQLSQQNGFVEIFSFYDFPEDVALKTLIGFNDTTSHGLVPPTFEEIFDFEIGSEYHYHYLFRNEFPPLDFDEQHKKKRILDKMISVNADTIIYSTENIRLRKWRCYPDPVMTIMDTVIYDEIFIRSEYSRLVSLPYQFSYEDDFAGYLSMYLNNDEIEIEESYSYIYSEEGCIEGVIGSGVFYDLHYGKCRGMFFNDNSYNNFRKLIYYKKANEEWGTPIDFNALDVDDIILPSSSFTISPNPSSHYLNIESNDFENENIVIELFNINGQNILLKEEWFNGLTTINSLKSFSGMVILKISTTKGVYVEKIMITDF